MISLKIKCECCSGYAVFKDLSLNYKLNELLKSANYYKNGSGFLCSVCYDKQVKKAG